MKIVVLVKQVPDTWGERRIDTLTGLVDRAAGEAILDETCERAVEVALAYKDGHKDAEVIALTMGPASAKDVLRRALSMGADAAVHVVDDALAGADLARTARVLAAAVRRSAPDLVVAGNESTDGRAGALPAMLAEHLGLAPLTSLESVDIQPDVVSGRRATEIGSVDAHVPLPAVISVTERAAEPRFPSFKGIMGAKRKPLEVLSLADLGVTADELAGGRTIVRSVARRPARVAGTKITDDGTGGTRTAEFLAAGRFI